MNNHDTYGLARVMQPQAEVWRKQRRLDEAGSELSMRPRSLWPEGLLVEIDRDARANGLRMGMESS